MVKRGSVVKLTESAVVVRLDDPAGGQEEIEVQRPAGSTYALAVGERVVWWPVWNLTRAPGWQIPMKKMEFQGRLVRDADLSVGELASVEDEVQSDRDNAQVEAKYQELVKALYESSDDRGGDG